VQDHPIFQSGHNLSSRDDVHQYRVGGDDLAESFGVSGLYLFLDIDGSQLLFSR
jgi:hypothetical protein